MKKLKWYWILLIAIAIVVLLYIIWKNTAVSTPANTLVSNTPVRNPLVVITRNTQDANPNGLTTYENPLSLTDSNGVKATVMGDKYYVNGLQAIKCCNARSAVTCKCTGWTWQPKDNCTDPGCGGTNQI